jgi:uncharacterized membrane protein YfcA
MFFPAAGIEVHPLIPPLVAFVISFFTSMGGVSGAFLLLPFQVSVLGYTTPSVSATNHLFNIVAIPSGVYRYIVERRMVWPLVWVIVIGTVPGVLLGAFIRISMLPDPKNFKLFASFVLLYIGLRMLREVLGGRSRPGQAAAEEQFRRTAASHPRRSGGAAIDPAPGRVKVEAFSARRIAYTFSGRQFCISTPGILALSIIVGIVGGVYGIGGGAIIAPFLITIFGLPVYTIAGAALMGTFVTSIAGVFVYQLIAPMYPLLAIAPDWKLGILFGAGGFAGIYCGARCQKYVPAKTIKWILIACIIFTAITYIVQFV